MRKGIAVIGIGYWGKNLVRNFFELNSLYAVCDSDQKALKTCKRKYPDIKYFNNFSSLLKDSNIKAIAISTPASTHYALATQAINADKDVFVEKPIALHYREGEKLVSLANKKSKILMVGHLLAYHSAVIKLKEMINKGKLGKINYIYSNRLNLGKFRTEENILWSFAPHDISIILNLLEEMPDKVAAHGGNYLNQNITDVTVTNLDFPSGTKAHIFVSWLHPYKEQKLIVIGDKRMVMFDDTNPDEKLFLFNHKVDWIDRIPVPHPEQAKPISIEEKEPLKNECQHFIKCIENRKTPFTDGIEGLRVLKVLEACQKSLTEKGSIKTLSKKNEKPYYMHISSFIDKDVKIREGTKIWHFSHILKNTEIGKNCTIGQNVMVGPNVKIGNNVKIQNNVSVYDGVTLEDDVFCGPSAVFTNVMNPRSHWPRRNEFKTTLVKKGTSIGANATIVCGITIGKYAFIGAGALVNKDVPDYALVYGVPAKIQGWMCYCGTKLDLSNNSDSKEKIKCPICGRKYYKKGLSFTEEK